VDLKGFFSELRRRNVYKVAVAYLVGGWAFSQGLAQVLPVFDISNTAIRLMVLLIVVGFPIALVLAWAFELTPEGLKTTQQADAMPQTGRTSNRGWIYVVIIGAIVSISLFFLGRYTAPPKTPASADLTNRSVAVLPFENLSDDPENAYFSEGVQDEILTRLAKSAELKVVSKTSTQNMKSAPDDLRKIAQQLGVTNILEGSVQKAGDQVRVNVQLIDAMTNAHLWAESYDRKLTDIFAVESEIARSIAETLQAKLTGSAEHVLASRPTENTEAYKLYLRGRFFWNRRTPENITKALGFFQQAIDKDPAYALAWAGVADAYSLMPIYTNNPPREDIKRAIAAANKALELDDTLAEAHTSLANALVDDLQFAASEIEFKRAISLNPNYATAHQWYGESLQAQGRFEEAFSEVKQAQELDPLSLIINAVLAAYLGTTGHTREAIQQFNRTLEMDPNFAPAVFMQAGVYEMQGDLKQALELYEKASNIAQTPLRLAMVARIYAMTGRPADARKILNDLTALRQRQYIQSYPLALVHLAFGEKEEALKLLEAAYEERGIQVQGNTGTLKADKRLDPLRNDPRFQQLVAKFMGQNDGQK
jgi:TolB-like protein/Tfp pilus assembly protein PilF